MPVNTSLRAILCVFYLKYQMEDVFPNQAYLFKEYIR